MDNILNKVLLIIIFFFNQKLYAIDGESELKVNKKNMTTIMEADSVKSDHINSKVSANGNVKFIRGKYKITADSITYDKENGKIYLENRAKLIDNENNNIFADKAELSDDVKTGNFTNAGIILNSGLSIVSPNIIKNDDNNYTSYNSDYYFCPNEDLNIDLTYDEIIKEIKDANGNKQLFSIYSKESHLNKEDNKIYLNHVFIKFLGIPFFYLPFITSSRPFDNRVSGLSAPSISKHSNYGYSVSLPIDLYFFDSFNTTIEPYFYQSGNILLDSNIRYKNMNKFFIDIRTEYAFDNKQSNNMKNNIGLSEKDEGVYRNHRLNLNIISRAFLGNNIFFRTNINYVTDPYMLRDYFGDYIETIQSDGNLFKISDFDHINLGVVGFQQIRERNNIAIGETPSVIPSLNYSYFNNEYGNFNFGLNTNILTSFSKFNIYHYDKFNFQPHIGYGNIFRGLYLKTNLFLYSDLYRQTYNNLLKESNYRIYPELEIKLVYPFYISDFDKIIFEPILQVFVSDRKKSNFVDLDSKKSELTMNNLFSNNRYSGYDLVEKGNRINYGVESKLRTSLGEFKINVGQSYRDLTDEKYRIASFDKNISDILMGINYRYKNFLELNYINNINSADYKIDRQEFIVYGFVYKFSYNISYIYVRNEKYFKRDDERQLYFGISYRLTKKIHMDFSINNNLMEKKVIFFSTGLFYEDNCFKTGLSISKQNFVTSFNENNLSINLSFRLKKVKI